MKGEQSEVIDVGWFVNKPTDVDDASMRDYIARGTWLSPTPAEHADLLATMRPGDSIALKSVTNRTAGLPFFNADRAVSTMTIFAIGRVRLVEVPSGIVTIDWDSVGEPRLWYFWTGLKALWRLQANPNTSSVRLLDFTFNGVEQDLREHLNDPFWRDRYPPDPGFSWIPFYTEVASRLADFRDDRAPLIKALAEAAESAPFLAYLTKDQYPDGTTGPLQDVDPFTVLGTFNRGMTGDNRRQIATVLGKILKVTVAIPGDFDGVPVLNNQRSWFFRSARVRDPGDIDRLWDIFLAALAFAETDTPTTRTQFRVAYDAARANNGVKWNLSQGLYWARPTTFATLEARSRPYIQKHFGLTVPDDGAGYLQLLDDLRTRFDSGTTSITSFMLLSYAAWSQGFAAQQEASMASLAVWAFRMAQSVDMEATEHDYKRATAARMREARDALHANSPEWPALFKGALQQADSLLHYMFKDDVAKAVAADPSAWAAILSTVWEVPVPESFDRFSERLKQGLGHVTPGNATGLGALLCLIENTETNAPYLTTRTEKWYRLTGFEGPKDASSATDRYATMLRFLDALIDEIDHQTGMEVSRLEAQGMAWTATEYGIPDDWDDATRAALETWRRGQGASEPPRAWLIRPRKETVATWIDDDYVSLAASRLGAVKPGSDLKAVKTAVEAGYSQVEYAERQALTADYHAFLTRMRPKDLVCTIAEEQLHIGRITGTASYDDRTPEDRLRRGTQWLTAVPIESNLPAPLPALLDQQGTVIDLTDAVDVIEGLLELPPTVSGEIETKAEPPEVDAALDLPAVTESVASSLYMEAEHLQEILNLLESRKQVVLYGPPGTGKTYIALKLARHIVGKENTSHHQLVQFHPSYAYEDFFEGYRPTETDTGQATFRIEPGPLRRIASDAKANPGQPFVLIIDEMNRANLAKVFGELYFLLEYRDQSIRLQYNPSELFQLPPNLYVIATMNTADRSIALLDAAMRRRFAFVELHPDEPPVRDVLATYLKGKQKTDDPRALLLTALNQAIEDTDRDLKIGPSYLMRPEAETEHGLERIWRHDILPLLEEHYYGRLNRTELHTRFGFRALRRELQPVPEAGNNTASDSNYKGDLVNDQQSGNRDPDEATPK